VVENVRQVLQKKGSNTRKRSAQGFPGDFVEHCSSCVYIVGFHNDQSCKLNNVQSSWVEVGKFEL
jgi:hypothetical protein